MCEVCLIDYYPSPNYYCLVINQLSDYWTLGTIFVVETVFPGVSDTFSIGYILVYSIFFLGAVLEEKFAGQNGLFEEFLHTNVLGK